MILNHKLDDAHARDPKAGDYWSEFLCPIAVVLAVTDEVVTICREKQEFPGNLWSWQLQTTQTMTRQEFNAWLRYGGHSPVADKTWANCHPNAHQWAREAWIERLTREEI
jgi:hypothetical protein